MSESKEEPENLEMNETEQHVVFETDRYQQSLTHAIWFGKKIPLKRKQNQRGAVKSNSVTEVANDNLSLEACKDQLCTIAQFYSETSKLHDREWEEIEKQRLWESQVRKAKQVSEITPLIIQLNEGMSLPTSLIKREDRIQRFKLQFFKFWPN